MTLKKNVLIKMTFLAALVLKRSVCSTCGKSYSRVDSLQRHQRYECGKQPQFQCPYCPRKVHLKHNLLSHIYGMHTNKFPNVKV